MSTQVYQTCFVRLIEQHLSEMDRLGNQVLRDYFITRGATPIRRYGVGQEYTIGFATNRLAVNLHNDLDRLAILAGLGEQYFNAQIFPVDGATAFEDLPSSQNNVLHNVWMLLRSMKSIRRDDSE